MEVITAVIRGISRGSMGSSSRTGSKVLELASGRKGKAVIVVIVQEISSSIGAESSEFERVEAMKFFSGGRSSRLTRRRGQKRGGQTAESATGELETKMV